MKLKNLLALITLIWIKVSSIAIAQTNPTPQTLPYSQNFTGLASSSSVYPVGWQGWNLSTTGPTTTFRTIAPPAASDLALQASATAASTTGGIQNYNGKIGFLPSPTVDATLCLALNTTGFNSVLVTFDVMTIRNPFDATNTRINQVDLQYRVGTTGAFISVSNLASGIYQNNTVNQTGAVTTPQNSLPKSFTLPSACNNQSVVQLRWVVRDLSGTGNRPGFAVDNIVVCSALNTPSVSISGPSAFCNGNNAVYIATPVNGGATPTYQWKKNGVNVGTNSPVLSINGLVAGNQISCTMVSNASCVSSITVNSNTITIANVVSSPVINSATITDVTCPGARDGAITLNISGGTPPYAVCWDTINRSNGPVFGVTVAAKTAAHPYFNLGNPLTYQIDGVEAKVLTLVKGISYTFNVLAPSHPFHISTDSVGGNANNIVALGQSGAPTQNGTVTFTPAISTPAALYYPCQFHQYMGYKINVGSGYCIEGSQSISAMPIGKYSVIVTDANGCTTSATYTISEQPSPISVSAVVSNSSCGSSTGAINLSVSGGVAPYTVCWDTLNTITGNQMAVMVAGKTPSNPYSALGNLSCYYINGEEMPSLNLVRGITYSFNVLSPGHPFHISTDSVGGSTTGLVSNGQAGAPNDNGTVTFTPNNAHPSLLRYDCSNHQYMGYRVNIVNGYCTEDLSSLKAGTYNVIVHDANGCEASASFTIIEEGDAPLLSSEADASCFNAADGSVELIPSSASGPYTISGTGPVFSVIAEVKNHSHPQFGLGGRPDGFTIDGVQGKELTLVRGITYSFSVLAPTHSFFISTSDAGGPANLGSVVTQGVVNNFVSNGTLLFTPDASHPALLYYQCGNHDYMGWKLNIVDGINNLSVSGLVAGDYTFSITDGTGCTSAPLPVTVHEPAGTVLYYDADGDMYGTNSETTIACSPFGSFVPDGNDCDDQNTAFNPGVTEICNGVDDDCDGLIDDLDPSLSGIISYSDIDTDGFGDPATQVITCTLPSGNVLNGLDCDDNNASVNPLAHETCNGIDDDCNGIIDDGAGCFVDIHVKCFIQGYFDGVSAMRAVADPLGSPSVCDTLRLDLADSDNPSTILFTATSTVSTSGQAIFRFPSSIDGTKFYFIFRHRSALETWSGESLTATDQAFFDFTADPVLTFGNNVIELTPGIFGFWNGDVNQDGVIDNSDLQSVETDLPLFTRGYLPQDLDGNLCIESADYSLIENNSVLGISVAHP